MLKELVERLLGGGNSWDGSDRRLAMRAKVDIELQVSVPGTAYLGRALDAGPRGVRVQIRGPWNARIIKKGQTVHLKYLTPLFDAELDTIKGKIQWAKKELGNIFQIGVMFDDDVDNLRRSWVKPILMKGLKAKTQQKRKQLRVRASIKTPFTVDGKEYEGYVRDLSTGGAMLECFNGFREGAQVELTLAAVKPHPEMRLKAVVRRCQLNLGTYQMGVAFLIEDSARKSLLKLIKDLVAVSNSRSL